MPHKKPLKAIILPGNGLAEDDDMAEVMWYGYMQEHLENKLGISCKLAVPPDPLYAREHIWKKFAVETMGLDADTLLIGHSSGAACALRLMEEHKTAGCILVSAYDNDLGDKLERGSGYFSRPFDYEKMKANTPFVIQWHSRNDHLVPVECAARVAAGLSSPNNRYIEEQRNGHYQHEQYPAFIDVLKETLLTGNVEK